MLYDIIYKKWKEKWGVLKKKEENFFKKWKREEKRNAGAPSTPAYSIASDIFFFAEFIQNLGIRNKKFSLSTGGTPKNIHGQRTAEQVIDITEK